MLKNSRSLRIEWGDCDPAGIVFYPRYFAMFDHSTTTLITAASGLSKYELFQRYDFGGYPMVDTRARFMIPCRFGDDVTIDSASRRSAVRASRWNTGCSRRASYVSKASRPVSGSGAIRTIRPRSSRSRSRTNSSPNSRRAHETRCAPVITRKVRLCRGERRRAASRGRYQPACPMPSATCCAARISSWSRIS